MAQPQDRRGLAVAWQDGVDVAELAPEPHQGCPEAGPAALDVGGDPCGDGGAGGLIDSGWHGIHDGRSVTGGGRGLPPGAASPTRVAGPLGALTGQAYHQAYHGYVPYPELTAWTLAQPFATAGSG